MNLLDFIYGWIFFTGMFWAVGIIKKLWMVCETKTSKK
jgi:hypothetical protein